MLNSPVKLLAAGVMVFTSMVLTSPGQAQELTRDLYRARVVDYCLYDQWARAKNDETGGILPGCQCAAKKYVDGLEEEEMSSALKEGTLSRAQKKVVLTRYAECRK